LAQGELSASVIKVLSAHLLARCPSLKKVYANFPNPSQKLEYPSVTVFTGKPKFNPHGDQYVIYKGDVITTGSDTGKFPVRCVVGNYEFNLQLDFWCSTKFERNAIWEEFFSGFNNNSSAMGLSLIMPEYFNTFAHYSISDFDLSDSEEQSQRSEWRIRVGVLVDCVAVIQRNESLIQTIENTLETPEMIEPPVEETGISII